MNEAKHTELPWWVEDHKNGCLFITAMDAPLGDICDLYKKVGDELVRKEFFDGEALANAQFIVTACNNHTALLGTLNVLVHHFCGGSERTTTDAEVMELARAAISAVEAGV